MTETKRRKINDFLLSAGFIQMTPLEERFAESVDNIKIDESDCVCLNLSWQVANYRFRQGLCESQNKENFERIAGSLTCVLDSPIKKITKDRFTFGIGV